MEGRVLLELDDIYNRHVAVDVDRIVAVLSKGDRCTELVLDIGERVQVKHSTSDVLKRWHRAVEVTAGRT